MTGSAHAGEPAGSDGQDPQTTKRSIFLRGELPLAHTVYGLILTLALVGELIDHEASATVSLASLLGASVVLLAAHLFSDVVARLATTRDEPNWSDLISISSEDVSVVYGGAGAAVIMAVAAVSGLDSATALNVAVGAGLVAVATLCFYGLSHHRPVPRLAMTVAAVALCTVIVVLENSV